MQVTLTFFPETAHCLNRDCLQLWFCLSAPSRGMHNSAAQGPRGVRGIGGGHRREREGEHSLGLNKLTHTDWLGGRVADVDVETRPPPPIRVM